MLVVVRHGRTAANAGGLLLGRADPPLDDVGSAQAGAVGRALAHLRPARIVSSPLARARTTAEAVAVAIGCDAPAVEVDERWVELDYGALDGVALADVPNTTWQAWRADASYVPGGGESMADLGVRVRAACADLLAPARDGDVVVVTHVSPVKAAVAWALEADDLLAWRLYVAPASITRIAAPAAGPVLHSFNETLHLGNR